MRLVKFTKSLRHRRNHTLTTHEHQVSPNHLQRRHHRREDTCQGSSCEVLCQSAITGEGPLVQHRPLLKPQRNPRLNLTGQPYRAAILLFGLNREVSAVRQIALLDPKRGEAFFELPVFVLAFANRCASDFLQL